MNPSGTLALQAPHMPSFARGAVVTSRQQLRVELSAQPKDVRLNTDYKARISQTRNGDPLCTFEQRMLRKTPEQFAVELLSETREHLFGVRRRDVAVTVRIEQLRDRFIAIITPDNG